MATQPPNRQTPGPESATLVDGKEEVVKGEATNDSSERPFRAPSEPMREDQVQNAVKFLSHPKVRGSPIIYRRSFLEKKGLTKEEIDEAFRRVPDPPSNVTSVDSAAINQAEPKPTTTLQIQAPIQSPQPTGALVGNVSIVPTVQKSRFHWSHALVAAGVLGASGVGTAIFFKNVVVPRLKSWIRKVVAEEKESEKEDKQRIVFAEQTAEAAKAAAMAAAVIAKASEGLLNSKTEERKYFDAFMNMMEVQVKEMKSMGESIRKLESVKENSLSQDKMMEECAHSNMGNGITNTSWRSPEVNQSAASLSSVPQHVKVNGTANHDFAASRPSSAPATVEPPPHPKSYMEIMAMIQRGERPPNIREIDDMPPNPNQQPSKPVLAPRPKPWDAPQQKSSYSISSQPSVESQQYPNQDNNILPFNPNERSHDSSEPWWKKKTVKITEIENGADGNQQQFPYNFAGSSGRSSQRGWVPPQPPAVAIPESAAAIRLPKKQPPTNEEGTAKPFVNNRIEPPEDLVSLGKETKRDEIEEVRGDGIESN